VLPGETRLHFVRSPHAHARVRRLDVGEARRRPGVVGVFTAADLPAARLMVYPSVPDARAVSQPPLAGDRVRFAGEPVVAVLAETDEAAADAAELVRVDYEPLATVTTVVAAQAPGAPALHADIPDNVACTRRWQAGDIHAALSGADHVVELALANSPIAALPLEPRGILAAFDAASGRFTVWCSTQVPHRLRAELASAVGVSETTIRVRVPDVGGGFGAKTSAYAEELVAVLLARQVGRPVKWRSTRTEDFLAGTHARDCTMTARAGFTRDGRLLGLDVRTAFNMGAYLLPLGLVPPSRTGVLVPGAYAVNDVLSEVRAVYTNVAPAGAFRGAGRPEAAFVIERLMDVAARDLGIDPAEIRLRNFVTAFPYTTGTGQVYDSGNYRAGLEQLLEVADYAGLRRRQEERRRAGEIVGIGLSTFVEPSGGGMWEGGRVRIEANGDVTALTGAGPHGQGTVTTLAQVVAATLEVPLDRVTVRYGDTDATPPGVGSFGSRTAALAGSALAQAAMQVSDKARRIAARLLECAEADIVRADGAFRVVGVPGRAVTLADVAAAAQAGTALAPGEEPGLDATVIYQQPPEMFSSGAYLAVVSVDPLTGTVTVERVVCVDDNGVLINPMLVEGQVHGAVAQGIGQALLERVVYDDTGQPLTGSLMDYAAPRADSFVAPTLHHVTTPTPLNPLGAKGAGEAAAVGSPPAIVNALVDALGGYGVRHLDMPVVPATVWAIVSAGTSASAARLPSA
jgi:carbon-monoxide dehydrogenase large subunit